MKFYIDAWSAIAPGLESHEAWCQWCENPKLPVDAELSVSLKPIPPMIRRRFRTLGKCAVGSTLPLLTEGESIASIFSSKHGDTALTLSLLEDIGRSEPVSPTSFSLAVHNAVAGLFTIARKDTSATTALAPMEHNVFQTLCEALGQLQTEQRLLCVIYDVPLAEFFAQYDAGDSFPYALAMIVSRSGEQGFELTPAVESIEDTLASGPFESEPFSMIKLLSGHTNQFNLGPDSSQWTLKRVECQT